MKQIAEIFEKEGTFDNLATKLNNFLAEHPDYIVSQIDYTEKSLFVLFVVDESTTKTNYTTMECVI